MNDPTAIQDAIKTTLGDVDALGLTGADRAVALGVALASRLGLPLGIPEMARAATSTDGGHEKRDNSQHPRTDLLGKIAARTKISLETVELIYHAQGNELSYVVSAKKLAASKAEATRQLAQIVLLGRQAAGLEEWTSSSTVREVVTDYGKFDSGNFAGHLMALDKDGAVIIRGRGTSREFKVTRTGLEAMAQAVESLVTSA